MASTDPQLPERSQSVAPILVGEFHVNELAADLAGALSPFGPEMEFPLPVERLRYAHPTPADRPHLADGR